MKTAIIELQARMNVYVRPIVTLKRHGVTLAYRYVSSDADKFQAFWELRRIAELDHKCTHVRILGKREVI